MENTGKKQPLRFSSALMRASLLRREGIELKIGTRNTRNSLCL